MTNFTDSAQSKQIDQQEHNEDAGAKRVVLRAQDPSDGEFYNISAVDNGDGTHSLSIGGTLTIAPAPSYLIRNISPSDDPRIDEINGNAELAAIK